MRTLLLLMTLALAAFAGCADDDGSDGGSDGLGDDDGMDGGGSSGAGGFLTAEDFTANGMTTVGLDGTPGAGLFPACEGPLSDCIEHPFSVLAVGTVTNATDELGVSVSLAWTNPATDLDLYLVSADGDQVASSLAGAPGTSEQLSASLDAGDYVVIVSAFHGVAESYTVTVDFEDPAAAAGA